MTKLKKTVYTATATATGGRDGTASTPDGRLNLTLSKPVEMGGTGEGVNPEQLFAAGYAACFLGALKFVAGQSGTIIGDDAKITGHVGFGPLEKGFGLEVALEISLPGLSRDAAEALAAQAHEVCPYSNATRGNIEVTLHVINA